MRATCLDEIRRAVHGRWMTASPGHPVYVEGVAIDSRKAAAGQLFVAIRGATHDGHSFLADAAAAGCVSAIVRWGTTLPQALARRFRGPIIGVEDTVVALGELARMHRARLAGSVIAVTGSVGKTTVKRMIHHVLATRLTGTAAPKSFNNAIGVPLTLLEAAPGDDYVVCELGTNAPGEIAALARIAGPTLAVITAVGAGHLQAFGSLEGVAAEKASILTGLVDRGVAVVNADSEPLRQALVPYGARFIRFGAADDAELRLTDWETDGLTQRLQVNDHWWVDLPVPGRHNAFNALAALAVALRLGLDEGEAGAALADFRMPAMRTEAQRIGPVLLVNDAYNANPTSMAAALAVLADLNVRRRVFVAGDMLELGPAGQELHLELGRQIARGAVDRLITVGALGRLIADGARAAGLAQDCIGSYETAGAAAADVGDWLAAGDGVLVKASRGVGAECIARAVAERAAAMAPED
ncbi:MAG: UDP-N-acetylmuramoyl-tripeptide--D-alanyl-D-alanine ligase [Planctomycetes bacterium]|nr:UDP-N-acetylmuramoyl-tripeptide--D-alanyl-D-alanine ligase [Planctomycetota bacterium]